MIKACRDCRYIARNQHNCEHPQSIVELADFLTGTTETYASSIDAMRTTGGCGRDADLFEPGEG